MKLTLAVKSLKANYGEGRWQTLPLNFKTILVISVTEYWIENHFTLQQMERCISVGFYFTSNSCNVVMIIHSTFLNIFISLPECFHAVDIPCNNNLILQNKKLFYYFSFLNKKQKEKGNSLARKKTWCNLCLRENLLITWRDPVLLQ